MLLQLLLLQLSCHCCYLCCCCCCCCWLYNSNSCSDNFFLKFSLNTRLTELYYVYFGCIFSLQVIKFANWYTDLLSPSSTDVFRQILRLICKINTFYRFYADAIVHCSRSKQNTIKNMSLFFDGEKSSPEL